MFLLERATSAEDVGSHVVDGGLKHCSGGFGDAGDVLVGNSACAEDASVCEPLGGQVSDGEFREDNVGSNIMNFLKFVIDDLPLSINDALEILDVADPDLCIFLFRLELELDLENDDLRIGETLGLLLEPSVGEGLLECYSAHQEGIVDRTSSHLLDSD